MERRKYRRTGISMFVFVRYDDGEAVGEVINASLNGVLVKTARSIPLNSEVDIHIQLSGTSAVNSVKFSGQVIRRGREETAIHIETIDMDSFLIWREMVNQFREGTSGGNTTKKREAS